MFTSVLDDISPAPHSCASVSQRIRPGLATVLVHDALWRITRRDGEVLGYVERVDNPRGERFKAKRLDTLRRRFLLLGEFWSIDDAIDCLRCD